MKQNYKRTRFLLTPYMCGEIHTKIKQKTLIGENSDHRIKLNVIIKNKKLRNTYQTINIFKSIYFNNFVFYIKKLKMCILISSI